VQSTQNQRTVALAIFQSPRFQKAAIVLFLSDVENSCSICLGGKFYEKGVYTWMLDQKL
jgi:hypothetical protein